MNIKKSIYSFLVALLALTFAACSPDEYSLGSKDLTSDDLVEGIAYTITHDESNPNIVYLKSLLPAKYTIMWDTPSGRYNATSEVTLKLPFAGDYQVRMGVETQGGYVYGPYTTFTVDSFYAPFVSDELWTYLSGGTGQSKRWYLDIDKNAVSRYFVGPLYFYGTADNWNSVTLGETISGDSWSWAADWAGNGSWLFGSTGAMDYGYMEFDLKDGANVTVVDNNTGKTYTGTYVMDTDNHTMTLTDAPLLHDPGREAIVSNWGNITILAMDESHMQLAVLRDQDPSEGNCLLSYNFISEDYLNNWTDETPDNSATVPTLASDWRDYVEPKTSKEMTYKLSDENPFDWCNLDGTNKNVTSFSAVSGVEDLTLVLNSGTNAYSVTTPEGDTYEGTYTLSDDGIYTFSEALPTVQLSQSGNNIFKSNADKTLRIMSYTTDDYTGSLQDLWLGTQMLDDQGNLYQYMAYHFVHQTAGAGDVTRYKGVLSVFDSDWVFSYSDNVYITTDGDYTFTINGSSGVYGAFLDVEKILKDHPNLEMKVKSVVKDGVDTGAIDEQIDQSAGDDATTARRYILNQWNSDNYFMANGISLDFTTSLSVTVSVKLDTDTPFVSEE